MMKMNVLIVVLLGVSVGISHGSESTASKPAKTIESRLQNLEKEIKEFALKTKGTLIEKKIEVMEEFEKLKEKAAETKEEINTMGEAAKKKWKKVVSTIGESLEKIEKDIKD